jgi:hypothetical protein
MTTLEALQSQIEYTNANLMTKALVDQGIAGTETYSATYTRAVDLACADICQYLLSHPDLSEGGLSVSYDKTALAALRDRLLAKHGVTTGRPTIQAAKTSTGVDLW